jgi:mRNA interferase RelE/StbE
MVWQIEFTSAADKALGKIDHQTQRRIRNYLRERVSMQDNPRALGDALKGELSGLWRYRVGDYRVICKIEDDKVVILVIKIGHRREVYS